MIIISRIGVTRRLSFRTWLPTPMYWRLPARRLHLLHSLAAPNVAPLFEGTAGVRAEALRRGRSEAPIEALVEVGVPLATGELIEAVLRLVVEPGKHDMVKIDSKKLGEVGYRCAELYFHRARHHRMLLVIENTRELKRKKSTTKKSKRPGAEIASINNTASPHPKK